MIVDRLRDHRFKGALQYVILKLVQPERRAQPHSERTFAIIMAGVREPFCLSHSPSGAKSLRREMHPGMHVSKFFHTWDTA